MRNYTFRPIVDGKKQCCFCLQTLPLDQFYKKFNKVSKVRYYASRCKKCGIAPAEKRRNLNLKANYNGFTLAQYNELLKAQGGVCASCGRPETAINHGQVMPLSVDHCHTTGAVRALLCTECNQALGMLHENPERIEALLRYVHERVMR